MLSFRKILIAFFFALFCGIILFAFTSYRNNKLSIDTAQSIKHTQEVLDQADRLQSVAKNFIIESNGYVITGDTDYLGAFERSKERIADNIGQLKTLTFDNPWQRTRIDSLQILIDHLIKTSSGLFALDGSLALNAAEMKNNSRERKFYLAELIRMINEIREEENRLLALRETANMKSIAGFRMAFVLMLAGTFILLTATFSYILHNFNKRRKAEEMLRQSEERFFKIFNLSPVPTYITETESSRFIYVNAAFENLFQKSRKEILGKTAFELDIISPEDRFRIASQILANKGKTQNIELRLRLGDTLLKDVLTSSDMIEIDGKPCFLTSLVDISERKKAEEDTHKALEKEKELSEMKSRFVSIASHEFRTPLSTILSSTALLERYTTTEEQYRRDKHIARINASVKNLVSILEELLSLEKIEEGKVELKMETFRLRELVNRLCGEMKSIARKGQIIRYDHEGKEEVRLDPVFIRHILTNLATNAIKYSPENTTIHVHTLANDRGVVLSVKDTGIGIPKEDQKHLFERFYRASNAAGIQGTGLGLHIAKRYVDMLNGSISVLSSPGKGTEFIVKFDHPVPAA